MTRALLIATLALAMLLVMACGAAATATPAPTPTPTPTLAPSPTAVPTVRPLATPTQQATAIPTPTLTEEPATLFLEVLSPANESLVNTVEVEVKGRTSPDAFVTIDSQPATVDATGNFSIRVKLEEGPNVLEVLASDFLGNQLSAIVTVIYVPA